MSSDVWGRWMDIYKGDRVMEIQRIWISKDVRREEKEIMTG